MQPALLQLRVDHKLPGNAGFFPACSAAASESRTDRRCWEILGTSQVQIASLSYYIRQSVQIMGIVMQAVSSDPSTCHLNTATSLNSSSVASVVPLSKSR